MNVFTEKKGNICTVIINRPEVRNAVDAETAGQLAEAFRVFDTDDSLKVAVLWGAGGNFCAGADLKAISKGKMNQMDPDMSKDGPMGPTRMRLSKPVIAAVSGYAVAGGLELSCWCDLRVVERDAAFGVFCRRFGVPLVDGGTQRLPRLIGLSRAMDMILTGRTVNGEEAFAMGLANRLVEPGTSRQEAENLAALLAGFPQNCLRSDREAVYRGFDINFDAALKLEFEMGLKVVQSGETLKGATSFAGGVGRHGQV
ncbi:enoyl-CoA hydratase/carnithine racemase [Desulfosporosinus orientis DSM 765]|uniref:Enoyl-CoA hydratase/carnithine racemase n=1 Tax=Desulfosporosinus orientis (strain ATCC 19365 / DSM 765 / NCIMB 8382 / VKM B-1628 / Singapore I) TaxID=768706 RepID=G7WGP8_DESOD|nr:crotonase/enoyl-CoA hydratase family protein [Desulfosporosinus orientis]AET68484.1 enoyl-CoA hydratase/carnithine racemase [Desulfosporosinus orientis DSM 765]